MAPEDRQAVSGRYTAPVKTLVAFLTLVMAAIPTRAQELVSFPTEDGGLVYSLTYGKGDSAIVLAHGGQFDKESWDEQCRALANAGFRVLAFDFRGYGKSRGPDNGARSSDNGRYHDVLAAVQYLRTSGAKSVSVIGASMGGDYAAEAAETEPKAIDRLVLLAAGAYTPLRRMAGPKLFIMSRNDVIGDNQPRLPAIRAQDQRLPALRSSWLSRVRHTHKRSLPPLKRTD